MAMESWVVYATNVCRRDGDVLLRNYRRWVTHKGSFATQNKAYINITPIYVKSMRQFT